MAKDTIGIDISKLVWMLTGIREMRRAAFPIQLKGLRPYATGLPRMMTF